MRIASLLMVLLYLQAVESKQPVVQNQESTTKSKKPDQTEQNKPAVVNSIDRPLGDIPPKNQKAEQQGQSDNRTYPVEIVSQPSDPTDPWVIVSVLISGLVALAAFIGLWITRKQLRLDQRAWVGIYKIHGKLRLGKPFVITIILKNTGKTPAQNLKVVETSRSIKKGEPITFVHPDVKTEPTAALLMPGGLQRIRKSIIEGAQVTADVIESIAKEEYRYVIYGTLTYGDIFGKEHWLRYYFWLAPDGEGYIIGPDHNDTGDGSHLKNNLFFNFQPFFQYLVRACQPISRTLLCLA